MKINPFPLLCQQNDSKRLFVMIRSPKRHWILSVRKVLYMIRGLNVAAIAEKVGLVPSAVYRHFKNKSEIVGAVPGLIQTRLNQHYQDVIQQNLEPVEKLNLLVSQHVEMIGNNKAIPRIIFSEEVTGEMPEKQQL